MELNCRECGDFLAMGRFIEAFIFFSVSERHAPVVNCCMKHIRSVKSCMQGGLLKSLKCSYVLSRRLLFINQSTLKFAIKIIRQVLDHFHHLLLTKRSMLKYLYIFFKLLLRYAAFIYCIKQRLRSN